MRKKQVAKPQDDDVVLDISPEFLQTEEFILLLIRAGSTPSQVSRQPSRHSEPSGLKSIVQIPKKFLPKMKRACKYHRLKA